MKNEISHAGSDRNSNRGRSARRWPVPVRKTYKLFIGGQFVRSESGRSLRATSAADDQLDNYARASRKDLRDAVGSARNAFENWAKKSAYLRGQILYRAAEMLQPRAEELASEIVRATGVRMSKAQLEVASAIDRLVYYAGWTDKYSQVFGSVNPVASSHFNFTAPEPCGVVAVLAPDEPCLLALVSLIATVILSGNSAVAVVSERYPLPALILAEILANSDLPAGVVNVLAGRETDLAPHIASHMDINAVLDGTGTAKMRALLQSGTGLNLKRYSDHSLASKEWFLAEAEDPYRILDTVELKTVWHPVGF